MKIGTALSTLTLLAAVAAPPLVLAQGGAAEPSDFVESARGPVSVPAAGLAEGLPDDLLERMWCSQVFGAEANEAFSWEDTEAGTLLQAASGRLAVQGFVLRDQAGIEAEDTRPVEQIFNREIETLGYPQGDAYIAAVEQCKSAFPL